MVSATQNSELEQVESLEEKSLKEENLAAKKSGKKRFVLELAVMLPLAILALEVGLGVLGAGQQEIVRPDNQLGCVHLPGKMVTWRLEGYSHERLNSQGLRDIERSIAKTPGVYRIAVLGDSSTEGLQVALDETYTRRLEKMLNERAGGNGRKFEVINFGCSSYSTGQELLYFQKTVKSYKPDLTVVLMCKGDILENSLDVLHPSKAEPRPYYYIKDGILTRDDSILIANDEKLSSDRPLNRVYNWLRANSNIYGVVSKTNFNLFLVDKAYYRISHFIQTVIQKASGKEKLMQPAYPMPDKRQVSLALVEDFKKEAASIGSDFTLMLFPGMGLKDPDWDATVEALKTQSKEKGYQLIDLQPEIEKHPDPNSLFLQFHFSKGGHQLTADALEKSINAKLGK